MAHARWLCVTFALLASAFTTVAQVPAGEVPDAEVIRKDVNEVNLTLTVTDGKGRFITGLTQNNFAILDDHQPPASVNRFQSLTDLPLRLCIVIDSSGSISHYLKFQQEVAIGFLKRIVRQGTDQACVIKFTSRPVLMQDFTDDVGKLEAGIRTVTSDGATAVWDSVRFSSELLARKAGGDPVRRVMVLITDGDDNDSAADVQQAIDSALRSEVAVAVVDTFETNGLPKLQKLASVTGGLFFEGDNAKHIATAMAKIEQSLRSGYFVAYEPAGELSPGHFRKIQVKTRGKGGRVAYRSGYFVPKPQAALTRGGGGPE